MNTSFETVQLVYKAGQAHIVRLFWVLYIVFLFSCSEKPEQISIGVFSVDATPPIGSPVAYAPAKKVADSLSARGIVIISDEEPIVLCSVDWLSIANEGLKRWKEKLAKAAHTTEDRVSVHVVHQHDGVDCDFTTEDIMAEYGLAGIRYDTAFLEQVIDNVAGAVRNAYGNPQEVTHIGFGKAEVEKVASNRRILGKDGNVEVMRWASSTDSVAIAAPEGLIDPWLKSISFWNNDEPLVTMAYYAVHPQSHYGRGNISCEFVGIARNTREKAMNGLPHIYFTGAAGDVAAGKYNDGSEERRPILAKRIEVAMQAAWENTKKIPVNSKDLSWKQVSVTLPLAKHLVEEDLRAILSKEDTVYDEPESPKYLAWLRDEKIVAAKNLAWLKWTKSGHEAVVSSLRIGKVWMLNLPGEMFVEYQLAAQKMKPAGFVVTAAYGGLGPGYIGTNIAYSQGGYETSERATRVGPSSEKLLISAIREVLQQDTPQEESQH